MMALDEVSSCRISVVAVAPLCHEKDTRVFKRETASAVF